MDAAHNAKLQQLDARIREENARAPDSLPTDDDHEAALDALPEDPPDVATRLAAIQSGRNQAPPQQTPRDVVVNALEVAAINLRDSELLKAQRVREYQEALNAFNKFVAPVPG